MNSTGTPWLSPGGRAGRHIDAATVRTRLLSIGIDLLGARNAALRELVTQAPAPIIATQFGYSTQVTIEYASLAGRPHQRYAGLALSPRRSPA